MDREFFKVAQIAIVVPDIVRAVEFWSSFLGIEKPQVIETEEYEKTRTQYHGKPTKARAKLAFIELENIVIELIEPLGSPSTWASFLEKRGPGIHHMAFHVKDPESVVEKLRKLGGKVEQKGMFEGGGYVYVDATETLGARIEILYSERHEEEENR